MSADRYSTVAIVLHWTIAAFVIAQLVGGIYIENYPRETDAAKSEYFGMLQVHKSTGITILLLSLARLGWRLGHKPPPLPAHMAGWEKSVARATHIAFYALIIGVPLGGWALVSASPFNVPTVLYGVIPWPHLPFFEGVEDRRALAGSLAQMHKYGAFLMIGLLALHVVGALKHHFVNRDDVLARMLPLVRRRSRP